MLGTGSAFAKKYYNTNALIYCEDRTVMLDCGITAPLSLHQLGKTFNDIDALMISHIHADHIGGMEEFALQMKYIFKRKPALFIMETLIDTLWETSLQGGLKQDEFKSLDDYFEVHLLKENRSIQLLPGFNVKAIRTSHIPGKLSYSFLINETFFYSADMRFDAELLDTLVQQGCTTIFHDCQFTSPGAVHTTLDELKSLPEYIQKRVMLMHYDDNRVNYEGQTGTMTFVEQHHLYSF
ncbi:MBL fold metallo-hydrolase [Paenibacillus sepulcri]|uniref:MBL fold metallo-hydrolase n=2 Tax=Paenibacillus sepulcri TaxID=359917 RepID=A0ABS7BX54_9BACL|nr:MBL fold metallo-hydrolase [Paenibacillus sepulcri]